MGACLWCSEPVLEVDARAPDGVLAHWECGLRMVAGGANHQLKQCTCCGGSEPPDPDALSKRQAARVAAAIFEVLHDVQRPDYAPAPE